MKNKYIYFCITIEITKIGILLHVIFMDFLSDAINVYITETSSQLMYIPEKYRAVTYVLLLPGHNLHVRNKKTDYWFIEMVLSPG